MEQTHNNAASRRQVQKSFTMDRVACIKPAESSNINGIEKNTEYQTEDILYIYRRVSCLTVKTQVKL